ncbi:F-box protein [Carex littledalei]|uniref:F-box protein n=1 Tax=Carex littledalei TaxID=544730 RepID=A0A833VC36_9POAL|nr:F-box protein [Carex littledalei]
MDCWSKLPEHLIEIFAEKLDSHRDFLSFSAVCTSWRSIFKNNIHCLPSKIPISHCLPKGKPLPLLVLYSTMDSKIHNLFSLSNGKKMVKISHEIDLSKTENKLIMGSWRGWLFVVDYITHEIALINPLTGEEVCLPSFPSSSSLSLVRIKLVVFSYPIGNKYDCMVMFVCNHTKICFCKVGDDKWKTHRHSQGIENLINHNGIFHAMDLSSNLYRITMMENTIDMQYVLVWDTFGNQRCLFSTKFLVESSGELLLVTHAMPYKHLDGIPHFEIFKLTSRYVNYHDVYYLKYEWQQIEDVGNQTIFLGHKGSISVESSLYHGMKGNCIYFARDVIGGNLYTAIYNLISLSVEYFSLDVDANLDGLLWFSPNPW